MADLHFTVFYILYEIRITNEVEKREISNSKEKSTTANLNKNVNKLFLME